MVKRGSGVILHFGGDGPQTRPRLGGFKIALDAIEGLRRQCAVELGLHGIHVVTLKTGGIPESIPLKKQVRFIHSASARAHADQVQLEWTQGLSMMVPDVLPFRP